MKDTNRTTTRPRDLYWAVLLIAGYVLTYAVVALSLRSCMS